MPTTRTRWTLVVVATLTMSVSYIDRQAFAVLAPSFTKELGIELDVLGYLLASFSFAYLVGAPLSGRFIDRVGARRGLLGAVLTWSGVAALHAIAPSIGALFGLRILLGLAESPSFPGSAQTVSRALEPPDRPRGFGVLFTGSSIGSMLVAPLAARLGAAYGFRTAFVLTALCGLLWVPAWLAIAWRGPGRALLEATPLVTHDAPALTPLQVLRTSAMARAICLVVASAPAIAFVLNNGAMYLSRQHGVPQKNVGDYLWLPPVLFDLGAIAFGDLSARARKRRGLAPDFVLMFVCAALIACLVAMPYMESVWHATLVAGIGLLGGGGMYALLTSELMASVPEGAVATAGGVCAAIQSITHIVALPLIGQAAKRYGSYVPAVIVLGVWALPWTIVWALLSRARLRTPAGG